MPVQGPRRKASQKNALRNAVSKSRFQRCRLSNGSWIPRQCGGQSRLLVGCSRSDRMPQILVVEALPAADAGKKLHRRVNLHPARPLGQNMDTSFEGAEKLWFNFAPGRPDWHTCAGRNFTSRQRIRRNAENRARCYRALPEGERLAVLAAVMAVEAE